MLKLCVILLLSIIGLSFGHPKHQNYVRREFKSFNVTPRDEAQVLALTGIRNSGQNQNQQYFYQGGQIQIGRSLEILTPNHLESQFRQTLRAANLMSSVKYDRVKMNQYSNDTSQGGNSFCPFDGPNFQLQHGEIEILRTNMAVEVIPPEHEWIRVQCWSGDGNKDRDSGPTTTPVTLRWDFNQNAWTKFWCKASRTSGEQIPDFAVFGDGVPKKSSTWRVDSGGKIRLLENSNAVSDFPGAWV